MSSNQSTSTDEDQPMGIANTAHGNGHVTSTNGKANAGVSEDSSMSEDEVPLHVQSSPLKSQSSAIDIRPLKRKKAVLYASSSEDEKPLASSPVKSIAVSMPGAVNATTISLEAVKAQRNGRTRKLQSYKDESASGDTSEDDSTPRKRRKAASNAKQSTKPPRKKIKKENEEDYSSDSDGSKPLKKSKKTAMANGKSKAAQNSDNESEQSEQRRKRKASAKKKVKKEESVSEMDPAPKAHSKTKKEQTSVSPKKKSKKEEQEEEEENYRWWEQQDPNGDGSIKWQTLEHNGVYFPPPYESLPSQVKLKYNGTSVDLSPESEEVAGFYGALLETDHAQDQTFNKNFFNDFLKVLHKYPPRDGTKIEKFELCDFRPMFEHFEAEKARKKAMTSAEKRELKQAKDKLEEKYTTCLLDGRKEKVGNFRIEPPGLFRGRGEHPKKGALKYRVRPEEITINIGKGVPIPVPNMPGKWKNVLHDQTVTWLANWTENVNGQHKYVFLAAGSSLKGQSDMGKFEKARELKKHVDRIRQDYNVDLRSKTMADRQRATAMYFIDRLALRAGNEKGEDEADTVGCCSLRCEHVTLEQPNALIFDFLGKDSIRYYNRVEVEQQIFKNIRIFKENKNDDDSLFDRVTTTLLNKHLASYMKGLTAKVFRTYNASITFQQQLDEYTPEDASVQEKLNAYNKANRMVAILCNHQRSVPKTHSASMEKMNDRLRGLKYDRMKLRHVLFEMDPKYKKKKLYAQQESDIDEDWIESHEQALKEKETEKVEKKFAKENEKLEAEGEKPQNPSVLKERLATIEEEFDRLEKERGTGKATLKRQKPLEKIEEAIAKLDEKIKTFKLQMVDREEGKEVSLGTSKINYLDPRITAAWCKIHNVPIEKLFSKTLLNKFPWALEVDNEWKF